MSDKSSGHPIGVAVRRTGLSKDVLRAWERRYAAVEPTRLGNGKRVYSDEDIRRLTALRRAVEGGRAISSLIPLDTDALEALADEDAVTVQSPARLRRGRPRKEGAVVSGEDAIEQALARIREFDASGLEAQLRDAAVAMSRPQLFSTLLVPLLYRLGELWTTGDLRPVHEHLASEVMRNFVTALPHGSVHATAPAIFLTTPPGQLHEFGALLATVSAASVGWGATYLGPGLPFEDLAALALSTGARAVGLSVVYPPMDRALLRSLADLRQTIPDDTAILVGGMGAAAAGEELRQAGVLPALDLDLLRQLLSRLMNGASA